MTKFPNQEGLNSALNIYRSAMRSFIVSCLEKVDPKGIEDLIVGALNNKEASKFEQELQLYKGNIEASIHINTFPHIIKNLWYEVFEQHFNPYSNIRSVISLIVDGRNQCAHLDTEDLDLDYTWTYLFLISDVLSQINRPDAKREIETILDELFPDDTDERMADMTKQLEAAKAEKTELEKQVKTKSDRLQEVEAEQVTYEKHLETESIKLKITEAGKTVAEERLSDISNRLEEAEVEKAELEKRLKTMSDRLKDVEKENAAYQKRVETISDELEAEKTKYEKVFKAASNQLATLKREKAQLEARLETMSTQLEDVKKELAACNTDIPDFVIFQGTTFIKHLDKYRVVGDAITQSFWNYWHSLGPEGKEELRDAGWSVEKVDDDYWEITVSPEDFQTWIEDEVEVREVSNLLKSYQKEEPSTQSTRPSYERTSLPTLKEMVPPALELFADKKEHRRVEMINLLTEHFSLDDDERRYISKTGQVEKHLMKEGLIERTRTGYYQITARGRRKVRQ